MDKTPTVELTGPSGTVSAPFDVTGVATFKKAVTPSTVRGNIYAYINNSSIVGRPKACTTETCTFSYQELTGQLYDYVSHGVPYTIRLEAQAIGGPTAIDTGSFSVDKMPTVTITSPPGGRVQTPFEIAGIATFKPTTNSTKGSISVYFNNGYLGGKNCTTETCEYSYLELYGKLYPAAAGTKGTLKLTATGGGASASDEREIFVEVLPDDPGCPDPPPGTCPICPQ